ncbi:hypothetical protein K438DRAFT_1787013 [Mycena galopus ATCC 62051]|nr:hypothetical protein K438DRAFT_1787013 [Mycena galopus ATCC 62051]
MSDPKQLYTKWIRRRKSTPTEPRPQDGNTPASTTPDVRPTSESAVASVLDSISLALDLAEQAVDIAQVAPFIAPAAALLRKIIESYKVGNEGYQRETMRTR